jgi:TRAP-type C4-dicarboxylate transport system substrate-binding protein
VGKDLRESVVAGTNGRLRGLSFTYSGGFRNLYSNQKLDSLSDVKGLKMRIPGGMMSRDLMDRLGVDMTAQSQNDNEWVANLIRGDLQLDEAETIRFERYARANPELTKHVKTVLETNHNLFLTMVTINGHVFDRLTPDQQRILEEEAQALAIKERELSIRQEQEAKKAFEAKGIRFIQLSEADRALLQSASLKVQAMHAGMLGRWMQAIRAEDTKHYAKQKPERISLQVTQ